MFYQFDRGLLIYSANEVSWALRVLELKSLFPQISFLSPETQSLFIISWNILVTLLWMARIKLDLHSRSHQHIENKDKHTFPEKTQFKATSLTIFFIHLQLLFQCNVSILLHTGPNIFCFGYWHTGRRNQTLYIWYITKSWQLGYPWKGLSKWS